MKFCDKLPKLRKSNNLSQEQLADRLGVSRQAVSKWESGQSHPDMEKMNEMCKILNCTLEDLLADGTINKERTNQTKNNFTNYVNDFLRFITKVSNMFISMSFKEKIKFLLEMTFIGFVLFIIGCIIYSIFDSSIFIMLEKIPKVGIGFKYVIGNLFYLLLIVIGIIVFIHLFKIRYLDYYVTIEDQNVTEKKIEEPIDQKETQNSKKEKIIIRDPKHSGFSFFECLATIIIILIKIALVIIAIPCIFTFITIAILLAMSLYNLGNGIIFLTIALAIIGALLINYIVLEFIYKFIVAKKQAILRLFLMFIGGLVLVGIGIGISISIFLSFNKIEPNYNLDYKKSTEKLVMKNNAVLEIDGCYDECNINYKIDNKEKNIKLTYEHALDNYYLDSSNTEITNDKGAIKNYNIYNLYYSNNETSLYKIMLKDIKNHKYRDYDNLSSLKSVTVTVSKDNYKKLIENSIKYTNDYSNE